MHNTLLSGHRGTTWVNTYLNVAYTDVVRRSYINKYHYDPIVKSQHHGDDIDAVMLSWYDSINFNNEALLCNIDAKKEKLLTEEGATEYLRLFYYPDGQVIGSLNRALS